MAMQKKWIQTATIAVDSETGAILVSGAGGGGGVEIVGLKNGEGTQINPATKESVDAVAAALGSPAQAGEVAAAIPDPATETSLAAIRTAVTNGLPVMGADAAGADAYAAVVTAPQRECHCVVIQLDAGDDAIVSFDGGTTDHLYVKGGNNYALDRLVIPAGASIQGRNAVTGDGQSYTNLRISVW
jgi:hypothetical protein